MPAGKTISFERRLVVRVHRRRGHQPHASGRAACRSSSGPARSRTPWTASGCRGRSRDRSPDRRRSSTCPGSQSCRRSPVPSPARGPWSARPSRRACRGWPGTRCSISFTIDLVTCLPSGAEGLGDEGHRQRLAQGTVGGGDALLPARQVLLGAGEVLAAEGERRVGERLGQREDLRRDQPPGRGRCGARRAETLAHQLPHLGGERWVGDVERLDRRASPPRRSTCAQSNPGAARRQVLADRCGGRSCSDRGARPGRDSPGPAWSRPPSPGRPSSPRRPARRQGARRSAPRRPGSASRISFIFGVSLR